MYSLTTKTRKRNNRKRNPENERKVLIGGKRTVYINTLDTNTLVSMIKAVDKVASNLKLISDVVDPEEIEVAELKMKIAKRMLHEYLAHGHSVLKDAGFFRRVEQRQEEQPLVTI